MAFLIVWLPLSLIEAILQTIPIETMREWSEIASSTGLDAAREEVFVFWDAVLEPTRAVNAVAGRVCVLPVCLQLRRKNAGTRRRIILIASMGVVSIVGASPIVETSLTIVEGALIGIFAVGAPREEQNPLAP